MVDFIGTHKDTLSLSPSQGPLIVMAPGDPSSSIATKVMRAQKASTETVVQVLITTVEKFKRLAARETQSNKLLVLASVLMANTQPKHRFKGGYWKSTRISSDTVLLSVYIEPNILLPQGIIESIIEANFIESAGNQINVEVPSLERYIKELQGGSSDHYLDEIRQDVTKIVDTISISRRVQRTEIGRVASVLSFYSPREEILAELTAYLKFNLSHLESLSVSSSADNSSRIIDSLIYLIFELADKPSLVKLSADIASAIGLLKSRNQHPVIFSRALRQSFLKGFDLAKRLPTLVDVMVSTETDDAAGFLLITGLLGIAEKYSDFGRDERLFRRVFRISKRGLVLLARDLRRFNLSKVCNSIVGHDQATSWFNLIDGLKPDRETTLAKCLVLHYLNSFGARMINWLARNHQQFGLEKRDLTSLSALTGFELPFFLDINKRLYDAGFRHKFIPPSRCRSLADYFNENLIKWKKTRDNAGVASDESHMPLVTVIFTTYDPNIKLFEMALESIFHQTYSNLEVIIIDDHSPVEAGDSITKLIDSLRSSHPHPIIYKRNVENVGQYASRNLAIELSKGEFIAVQDDDDISHPERLQKQIFPMLNNSAVQATHALHIRISENARIMSDGNALDEIPGDGPVSFVWRRRVFDQIGPFLPTKTRGDIEFRTRLHRHYGDDSILTVPHPLVIMRGGMGTVSASREYYYRNAVSAFRFMMMHITSDIVESKNMQKYIPSLLQ